MRKIVGSDQDLCMGCNRCTRECPIEMANLTYQDRQNNIKVKIDNTQCISCGACIPVCKHGARYYLDDIDSFFKDLAAGLPIFLIVAPAMKTNFPQWKQLLAYLRLLGVQKIYDASLGADICVWAHLRYLEKYKSESLITQTCPVIVSYCETHHPELLAHLSPIHSPMGCTAVYMRNYEGIEGKIAAISPCVAKTKEFEDIGIIDYNITFAKLEQYLERNIVKLPQEETGFDHDESDLGSLFSLPGGFCENIEFFLGKSLRIDNARGPGVFQKLDIYAKTDEALRPRLFEVLSCPEGCNTGSGGVHDNDFFRIRAIMDTIRQTTLKQYDQNYFRERCKKFDKVFDLSRFLRKYEKKETVKAQVSEAEIQRAFLLLEKDTYAKQNFNCGACGSASCRDMARRIALKINIPINCIVKSRNETRSEQRRNVYLYKRNAEYIELVHSIGEYLLAVNDSDYSETVTNVLASLCSTLRGSGVHLWKNIAKEDEPPSCKRIYGWPVQEETGIEIVDESSLPNWVSELKSGNNVGRNQSIMSDRELALFKRVGIASVLAVPIIIKGKFWGFISINSKMERSFAEEDVSVIIAGGILLVSSIIEQEMTESLIIAREEALAGTRAKSDFLSRMSHEIRTPMNAIIGMTKIAENINDITKLRYCLSTINASSTHLLGLINDILDMSKIEAGKFELDSVPFNIETMLIKICNIINDKTEQKKQKLNINLSTSMHMDYTGDELRLSQVITNLLSNAVKFTPDEGRIVVIANEMRREGKFSVLRFSISDTGIGMTAEQMGRLFNAFSQADKNITQRFGGTGLGLAISKNIVEKMNGKIWVESEPGRGASFIFEVRLLRDVRRKVRFSLGGLNPLDIRLLLVDMDRESQRYFKSITGKFGMPMDVAVDMSQAMDLVKTAYEGGKPYHVVFLNIDPGIKSLELVKAFGDGFDKNTVVIITSFLEWSKIEEAARAVDVTRFIAKPIFSSGILDAINQVIGGASTASAVLPGNAGGRPDFSGVSLLLAEDIEINREIFIALLEDTKVVIDTAENGFVAVGKFQENPDKYDLIIMDVQMPEMDGYEATQTIRSLEMERAGTIPIIAMTANAFKEDIDKCLQSGMNDHLTKPIDEKTVIEKIAFYSRQRKRAFP